MKTKQRKDVRPQAEHTPTPGHQDGTAVCSEHKYYAELVLALKQAQAALKTTAWSDLIAKAEGK